MLLLRTRVPASRPETSKATRRVADPVASGDSLFEQNEQGEAREEVVKLLGLKTN
jgi:hypothetical protein